MKEFKPAPAVAYFSARGPGALTEAILKVNFLLMVNSDGANVYTNYPWSMTFFVV